MSQNAFKLLAKGLAQDFAGGTVMSGVKRSGFDFKSSHLKKMEIYIMMSGLQIGLGQVRKLSKLEMLHIQEYMQEELSQLKNFKS